MNKSVMNYDDVPAHFPRPVYLGAVGGAQDKLLLVKYAGTGKFYLPGCTPPEIHARWTACEDLARQLQARCLASKAGKRAYMSEVDILDQYLERLLNTGWHTDAEIRWVTRRAAGNLGWPIPESATEANDVRAASKT